MRTTLNIDTPILTELKRRGRTEHVSLGRLVSTLLARSLRDTATHQSESAQFTWINKPMGSKIDIADRDALLDAMDGESTR